MRLIKKKNRTETDLFAKAADGAGGGVLPDDALGYPVASWADKDMSQKRFRQERLGIKEGSCGCNFFWKERGAWPVLRMGTAEG